MINNIVELYNILYTSVTVVICLRLQKLKMMILYLPTPKIFLISNFISFPIKILHVTKIKNLAYISLTQLVCKMIFKY